MKNSSEADSPFSRKTLQHFNNLLMQKREEAVEQLAILDRSITELAEADDADHSSADHHLGDVGSDVEGEELNYQLKERTHKFIKEIDDALDRIENGTYGICQATGKVISKERLEAVPHTRFSIEAKKGDLAESS